MTTPRVTENPIAMVRVEPDSFIDDLTGPSAARRRLAERRGRERRTELVRRALQARDAETSARARS
jgi:hypothetical protein